MNYEILNPDVFQDSITKLINHDLILERHSELVSESNKQSNI